MSSLLTRPALCRAASTAGAAAALAVVALMRMPRITIAGHSMLPTLQPGDRILVLPAPPRAGRLVVLTDPREPSRLLVKRAATVDVDGLAVRGDNPARSTDSRTFGTVPRSTVRGRPLYRYSPAERARWLWRA